MRILFVATGLQVGGAERQVAALAAKMLERGHVVAVAVLVAAPGERRVALAPGIEVFELGMTKGRAALGGLGALARAARTFRPDVVHANMIHANILSRLTRIACRMPRLVCTAHSDVETDSRAMKLLYRLSDPLCDVMTNVSDAAVGSFVRQGLCPARKIRRVHDGVEFSDGALPGSREALALRRGLGLGDGAKVVAYAGRLELEKGCDILAEAIVELRAAGRSDIGFAVFGDGSLRGGMEARAGSLPGVRFFGMRDDVRELYRGADVFVMPSRHEGFGLALVEAIAAGMDPVVSDCAGPAEILGVVGGGRIVPRDDPRALAASLAEACDALPSRDELERRAFRARDAFSLDAICDVWEEIYCGGRP